MASGREVEHHRQAGEPGIPIFTVYESGGEYVYSRKPGSKRLATFERERTVIAAGRDIARAIGAPYVRVVFVVPTAPEG
jgi:hypothetical protein